MVLLPNIIKFSLYDAQWNTGHYFFVHVAGLTFYYFWPKFQALQAATPREQWEPGALDRLNMCLSTVVLQSMFLSVCFT